MPKRKADYITRDSGGSGYFPAKHRAFYSVRPGRSQYKSAIKQNPQKWKRGGPNSVAFFGPEYKLANQQQLVNRAMVGYVGKGDYRQDLNTLGSNPSGVARYLRTPKGWGAAGSRLAGAAAGYMTSGIGGIGHGYNAGKKFSQMMGWGDYGPVVTNDTMQSQQRIAVNQDSYGDITIDYREFLQNVTVTLSAAGTSTFNLNSFSINPGLQSSFPFLSQISQNFTLYEFEGLMYQYVPTSGEFGSSSSNQLGKVIMATNYDPDANNFNTSQQMENYQGAASCKPSCGQIHGVETEPSQRATNQLYVRTGDSSKDKIFTDLGTFQIATEGISGGAAGTYVIGELWVTYKIKLLRPYLLQQLGNSISQASSRIITSTTAAVSSATEKSSNSFALEVASPTASIVSTVSSLYSTTLTTAKAMTIYLPENLGVSKVYRVSFTFTGQSSASLTNYFVSAFLTQGDAEQSQCYVASLGVPWATLAPSTNGQAYNNVAWAVAGSTNESSVLWTAPIGNNASLSYTATIQTWVLMNNPSQLPVQLTFQLNAAWGVATAGWVHVVESDPELFTSLT